MQAQSFDRSANHDYKNSSNIKSNNFLEVKLTFERIITPSLSKETEKEALVHNLDPLSTRQGMLRKARNAGREMEQAKVVLIMIGPCTAHGRT